MVKRTFNELLEQAGLDPALVRLVRHHDPKVQQAVFDAALGGESSFDEYQEHQSSERVIAQFRAATYLAAFVVEPGTRETVFVGIWERLGERPPLEPGTPLMVPGTVAGMVAFETRRINALDGHRGRLVIDWGGGARAWVQRADRQDKPLVKSRKNWREP